MPQLVRIATAGSVDDGKSTLIGRLMYDSKTIFSDQLAAVERASHNRGEDQVNLALLTDGLRAEREQGITIDVAYRYFATPKRKFIIADTPGHIQYTRNMVTGASTAEVALILVDARNGVLEQSRRHAFLAGLLGIRHLVVCVNKMDLVDWSAERFDEIRKDFRRFAAKLDIHDITYIPLSALHGDNIVNCSAAMPWYEGTPLLHHLEELHVASDRNLIDARFPVQYVIHQPDFRGYAGSVAAGVIRVGDDLVALPSGFASTVRTIWGPGGSKITEAFPPQSVVVELSDQLDVGRGDILCRPGNQPHSGQSVDAVVCWLTEHSELTPGRTYTVLHTTRSTKSRVRDLSYRLDVNTLDRDETARALALNEIGRVTLNTQQPLQFDAYRRNRSTGSFILIDETSHDTVAAGMVIGPSQTSSNVVWDHGELSHEQRGNGATIWLSGLSGSGKSGIAVALERQLIAAGRPAYLLDGDYLRHGLNADLGFGPEDHAESVRRMGAVAQLFAEAGMVAIAAPVSPYCADRVRALHAEAGQQFIEVFVDTPLGAYARADEITDVDDAYEPPEAPDLILRPEDETPEEIAGKILNSVSLAGLP